MVNLIKPITAEQERLNNMNKYLECTTKGRKLFYDGFVYDSAILYKEAAFAIKGIDDKCAYEAANLAYGRFIYAANYALARGIPNANKPMIETSGNGTVNTYYSLEQAALLGSCFFGDSNNRTIVAKERTIDELLRVLEHIEIGIVRRPGGVEIKNDVGTISEKIDGLIVNWKLDEEILKRKEKIIDKIADELADAYKNSLLRLDTPNPVQTESKGKLVIEF